MQKEESFLIQILKSLLQGEKGILSVSGRQEIDFERLYLIAKKNSVANMVAFFISKCDDIPSEIKQKFEQQRMIIMMQQMKCEKALSEMCEIIQNAAIRGLVLKGTILKSMYPEPFMRSMSDIDIYMEEEGIRRITPSIIQAGFSTGTIGSDNHFEFLKYEDAKIEFHPELVARDSAYGKNVYLYCNQSDIPIAQAMDIWSHTESFKGNEYVRQLTPEYHYLYIIMHMMNHFLTAGTGIRSVMDIWVMNHHYAKTWNRKEIESLLEEYGLLTFERYVLSLADRWFDLEGVPYLPNDINPDLLDTLGDYIIGSGTYGTSAQSTYRLMGYKAGSTNKVRYLSNRLFLPYETMKNIYPVLEGKPILLPAMWVRRGVEVFKKRRNSTTHKMRIVANADQEAMEQQKRLIDAMIDKE